jgi:hypothetical protein
MSDTLVSSRGDRFLPHDHDKAKCVGHSCVCLRLTFVVPVILLMALMCLGATWPGSPVARSSTPGLANKTLRVMTYNIHVGVGMDKKLDLQRIADVINREHPDLVGLQEVDRGVKRTEARDEIAELAKLTNMQFAFAHNLDYQGGQYGVAILSRFPIGVIDHQKYENRREAERRGMIRVEVKFEGKTINFAQRSKDILIKIKIDFTLEGEIVVDIVSDASAKTGFSKVGVFIRRQRERSGLNANFNLAGRLRTNFG